MKWFMFELDGEKYGPTTASSEDELKRGMLRLTGKVPSKVRPATPEEIEKYLNGGESK